KRDEQRDDFRWSRALVQQITGRSADSWTMCYPHGSYNADTLEMAREAGCALCLTTRPGVVHDFSQPFELPRIDAADFRSCGNGRPPSSGTDCRRPEVSRQPEPARHLS